MLIPFYIQATRKQHTTFLRCLLRLMLYLLLLSIFGLLILVIIATLQMKDMEHTQTGIVPSKLCLPCEALYVNPAFKSVSSFTVTGPEGRETCCLKTEHDVGKLVELMSEKAARLKQSTDRLTEDEWNCLYNITNRATEVLKLQGKTTADNGHKGRLTTIHWDTDSMETYRSSALDYNSDSGKAIVVQDGFYFLYSQLTFLVPQDEHHHERAVTHSIYQERHGHLSKLFHASESVGKTDVAPTNVTTYVGGAVHLRRGDRAMVKSYSHQWSLPSVHSNFFGMFKVS